MATKAVNLAKGHHYHCDYCSQDISHTIRIRCAECNDFDLCVECFSVGVELEQHTNDHDYFVMDRLNFPVINLDWLATEELLLLEGIELHGMGNWDDIAEHVSTKTAEQCSQHYFQQYIEGPSAPLPELAPRFSPEEIAEAQERAAHTVVTKPVRKGKTAGSQPIDQDLGGYMPRRGEFEFEYDNDAEFLLMDMEFHDVDTPLERELKLATLHMYNERLLEREAKRDFVVRHQLMDLKRTAREEQQRSKENKALYARTKKALQLLDKSEALEDFVQDLSAEQELQKRIDKLIEYRLKGIRTMLDANHYEGQIRRRETQMRKQRRESSNIYGYPERSKERGSRWINRDRGDATAQPTPSSSTDSLATSTPFDLASAPGYDLLSMKERQLCETLYLYPSQYTLVKEAIIRECAKTGSLQKSTARFLAKTDVYKTSAIFDFLQASGWINTPSASSDA